MILESTLEQDKHRRIQQALQEGYPEYKLIEDPFFHPSGNLVLETNSQRRSISDVSYHSRGHHPLTYGSLISQIEADRAMQMYLDARRAGGTDE